MIQGFVESLNITKVEQKEFRNLPAILFEIDEIKHFMGFREAEKGKFFPVGIQHFEPTENPYIH
jgi:hypothetical protein